MIWFEMEAGREADDGLPSVNCSELTVRANSSRLVLTGKQFRVMLLSSLLSLSSLSWVTMSPRPQARRRIKWSDLR